MAGRRIRLCRARARAGRRRRGRRARLQKADQAASPGPRGRRSQRAPPRSIAPIANCAGRMPSRSALELNDASTSARQAGDPAGSRSLGLAVVLLASCSSARAVRAGRAALGVRQSARPHKVAGGGAHRGRWTRPLQLAAIDAAVARSGGICRSRDEDGAGRDQPRLPSAVTAQPDLLSSTAARRSTMPWSSSRTAIRCATGGRSASLR